MVNYLFSPNGRLNRARFWLAALIYVAAMVLLVILYMILWQIIPGTTEGGEFKVEGVTALPYIGLGIAYMIVAVWSGICVAIKRFHDRGKSGAWVLIQLIPIVGALWYFIEAGCLRGTVGPNQYGPDPLGATLPGAVGAYPQSA